MSRPSSRNHSSSNNERQSHSRSNSRRSSVANGNNSSGQPDPYSFCNSFWGEYGYEVLQNKNRYSTKVLDDLRLWYKERAAIEEDYAKRLTKLTKSPLLELHHSTNSSSSSSNDFEVGGIKRALETVRDTTRQSAHSHLELAGTIRIALEKKVAEFVTRREGLKKNPQAAIERLHKKKAELMELAEKSRKKYEANAIAVNGLSAQSHLVQGRDYDKVTAKLEKAQQNVQMDEREYRSHVKNLKETTAEWNMQWKGYCDLVQDLEEERIDFVRTSFWDYANGVSTICVVDDEQCEIIRKALERCDTAQDVAEFVRQARTGSDIYVAPEYVNYSRGEQTPYSRAPAVHANFARSSIRNPRAVPSTTNIQDLAQAIRSGPSSPTDPVHPAVTPTRSTSKAAVKRGGAIADAVAANSFTSGDPNPGLVPRPSISHSTMGASISRAASPAEAMAQVVGSGTSDSLNSRQSVQSNLSQSAAPPPVPPPQHYAANHHQPTNTPKQQQYDSKQEPAGPPPPPASSKPFNRYAPNYGNKEPAHSASGLPAPAPSNRPASRASTNGGVQPPSVPAENGQIDPLVAALEKLRSTPSISSFRRSPAPSATPARGRANDEPQDGRRSTLNQPSLNSQHNRASSPAPSARRSTLDQPSSSSHDPYKRAHSPAVSTRRSTLTEPQPGNMYQRASSPGGQRTTLDQPGSYDPYKRASSPAVPALMMKPPSDMRSNGGGRSPSPQPHGGYNRGGAPSPAPSSSGQAHIPYQQHQSQRPQQQPQPQHSRPQSYGHPTSRSTMPLGVALDARGGVMEHQSTGPIEPSQAAKPSHQHSLSQSSMSMISSPSSYATSSQLPFRQQQQQQQAPPPPQNHAQHPTHHSQPPPQSTGYGAPRPPQHYGYPATAPPVTTQPPPPSTTPIPPSVYNQNQSVQPQYSMPPSQSQPFGTQQQQHSYYGNNAGGVATPAPSSTSSNQGIQRTSSVYGALPGSHRHQQHQPPSQQQQQQPYYQQPPPQQQQPQQQPPPQPQQPPLSNSNPKVPSPTGNYTESGQPILFYVRALYDYTATMPEEFSFQANDIIAITQTDPDGWWQGELLDEFRRAQNKRDGNGGNVLPSNFVDLLN
ncbi:hypothetical protein MJO29_013897 [Puccinia striiformis f. sp. tritici]|uniref:F-BAR domain-containing protein n=1 Tax=Puccinia striiformis f. sp. tritici PST-78 TaxID=1165861 RepID=A0A0L0W0V1_9BASI|nr:hypothetical protein MJO29_013897 [Puccinia striiformis f. sp. tritici]KNF05158.1 hypothetical protein PSTG_01785 [Puccinia striiformis f. sp. tritici PST-78]